MAIEWQTRELPGAHARAARGEKNHVDHLALFAGGAVEATDLFVVAQVAIVFPRRARLRLLEGGTRIGVRQLPSEGHLGKLAPRTKNAGRALDPNPALSLCCAGWI